MCNQSHRERSKRAPLLFLLPCPEETDLESPQVNFAVVPTTASFLPAFYLRFYPYLYLENALVVIRSRKRGGEGRGKLSCDQLIFTTLYLPTRPLCTLDITGSRTGK